MVKKEKWDFTLLFLFNSVQEEASGFKCRTATLLFPPFQLWFEVHCWISQIIYCVAYWERGTAY